PSQIAGEEMGCGACVRRGVRGPVPLCKVGREPLVEALDGNVDDGPERLDEALGCASLLAPRAPHCQRQADDDAFGALVPDELAEPPEPPPACRDPDDAARASQSSEWRGTGA